MHQAADAGSPAWVRPFGRLPAENARKFPRPFRLSRASAIIERAEFPVHRNSTLNASVLATSFIGQFLRLGLEAGARPQPVVHARDRVLLWREERNLRLQLAAVAEQSGAVGESIRVRIPGASWGGGMQADQPVRGIVRGPAEVEMEP